MKYILFFSIAITFLFSSNNIANQVVHDANKYIGKPYVWGGNNLNDGVDCSAFVKLLYAKHGITLPRTAKEQALNTKEYYSIKYFNRVKLGDALYFKNNKGHIHHVAIVTGFNENNRPIITHAKGKEFGIVKETISDKYISEFIGAKRFYAHSSIRKRFRGHPGRLRPLILK